MNAPSMTQFAGYFIWNTAQGPSLGSKRVDARTTLKSIEDVRIYISPLSELESCTMIELPFGNGATAALVFLIFELVVFPTLIDATNKAASFFSHNLAKRDKNIRVESLSYPLWNEGLYNRQLSHALLFLLRIVSIAIPVYLETRLDFRDHHDLVTKRVQHAFVTEPILDWLEYSTQKNSFLYDLRDQAELVFDRCSFTDDDGWVTASIGNVTYSSRNDLLFINCVDGTSKQIYRTKAELPGEIGNFEVNGKLKEGKLNGIVSLSCVEGPLPVVAPSFEHKWNVSNFRVVESKEVNVSVANATGFACFQPMLDELHGNHYWLVCHNMSGSVIDYYFVDIHIEKSSQKHISSQGESSSVYEVRIGPLDVVLEKLATLEFREQVLVTAEHVANMGFGYSLPEPQGAIFNSLRRVLYSRSDNLSVTVPGDEVSERTVVDEVIIIIGAIEVGAIMLFGLVMQLCYKHRWKHIQRPNTVDGLSQCWARSITGGERRETRGKETINLRLRKTASSGVERMVFEPVTRYGQNMHEEEG